MPHSLKAQPRVQWLATPLSWVYPLSLASQGWSSPAILSPQDRTENLTSNSPTLQPLNHVVDEPSCQNVSIYAQAILNYQRISKIQNWKFWPCQELNQCHQGLTPSYRRLKHLTTSALNMNSKSEYTLEQTPSCQLQGQKRPNDNSRVPHWFGQFCPRNPKIQTHF